MAKSARSRGRDIDKGATAVSAQLGKTVQRLRRAYSLSLSELAEQSGVAKSIISQIERNETNPTLATVWRLSRALDVSIERVLASDEDSFIEKVRRRDIPSLVSEDGKVKLAVIGWSATVEWLQWYHLTAEPGGVLESDPHQNGSVECLSILEGEFEVSAGSVIERAHAGETLRYRSDRSHRIACLGDAAGQATMVCILQAAVME